MTQQLDTLFINDLPVSCIIGIFENERKEKQPVIINIALSVDTRKAGQTDDINDTVSYYDVANEVYKMVEKSQFELLEKLGQAVADICLKDKRVKLVTVHIEKPQALPLAKSSAIEITRQNE
ncbi:MAG TPA: dihydroneopterin aldolase [Candidatus Acidoferrales bacterium]|nr:dihydroneopterin aldolase [Candidatus Acidoferrales bacterium]